MPERKPDRSICPLTRSTLTSVSYNAISGPRLRRSLRIHGVSRVIGGWLATRPSHSSVVVSHVKHKYH